MDIQLALDEFGIEYKQSGEDHHARMGWIQLQCPWCGHGSGKYHLGININSQHTNCYTCGYHSLFEILVELTGESSGKCWAILNSIDKASRIAPKAIKHQGRLSIPSGLEALRWPHRAYLKGRGLDIKKMVELWNLQGIGIANRLSWRIWIPVHYQGELVNWTTRSIGSGKSRYIHAPLENCKIPLNSLLFGEDYCRHSIIITEGPFDVFAIGPGAVATCGLGYSKAQVDSMSKYPIRVVCFDSETNAQRRARKLASTLKVFPGETHLVRLESGKDAGEASQEEIEELREKFLEV